MINKFKLRCGSLVTLSPGKYCSIDNYIGKDVPHVISINKDKQSALLIKYHNIVERNNKPKHQCWTVLTDKGMLITWSDKICDVINY